MSARAAEVGRKVICADDWRVTMHVEVRRAHWKGQIVSARDLPTGCQQRCSLVVPTVRAPRCLIEPSAKSHQKQPAKRPEREPSARRRAGCLAQESKSDPKGGDESLRKLHESLVHNNQHATRQRHGQQNRSGSTRRGDRCCHVGGLGRRTNLCAPLRFGLHRLGHELAACRRRSRPDPDPEPGDSRAVMGAGYADRWDVVCGRANPGGFGCGAVAVSGEVDDG